MTKEEMREMENRIRQLEEEPYNPSPERIEAIKQRAFEEYQMYLQIRERKRARAKKRRRSILRRVVVVAAVAVCFFAASVVYSVFAPVFSANANNFVRKAAIWINNQFHLGITFSTPVDDSDKALFSNNNEFTSIDELISAVNMPIVFFNESDDFVIKNIEISNTDEYSKRVSLHYYSPQNEWINIYIEPLYDRNTIGINTSVIKEIITPIGSAYLWTDDEYSFAFIILNGSETVIKSSVSLEKLEQYCSLLSSN